MKEQLVDGVWPVAMTGPSQLQLTLDGTVLDVTMLDSTALLWLEAVA